jgi:hypothetical protein
MCTGDRVLCDLGTELWNIVEVNLMFQNVNQNELRWKEFNPKLFSDM